MRESLPGLGNAKAVLLDRATQLTFTALPRIPERAKRVLLGGRPVVVDGNTLDATLQMLLLAHRVGRLGGVVADRRPNDGVAASRAQLRLQAARLSPPIRADVTEMSIPGPAGPMSSRLYVPDGSGATPKPALLLYFHGGGFVLGDLDTHDSLCRLICRDGGLQVLAVDYRLAPEHPAPAAVDDAWAARIRCHHCNQAYIAHEMDRDPSSRHEPICLACASDKAEFLRAARAEARAYARPSEPISLDGVAPAE
mgnify:CR=1 FL=1